MYNTLLFGFKCWYLNNDKYNRWPTNVLGYRPRRSKLDNQRLLPARVKEPDPPMMHQRKPSDSIWIEPDGWMLTVPPARAGTAIPGNEPEGLMNKAFPFWYADPVNIQLKTPSVSVNINIDPGQEHGAGTEPVKLPWPAEPVAGTK